MVSNTPGNCKLCGLKLQQQSCRKCSGKGTVRTRLLQRTECPDCKGSGITYVCPEQFQHDWADFNKRMGEQKKRFSFPSTKLPTKLPKTHTCPLCKGAKGVPHPGTGMPGPCPQCGGRGWVVVPELR